MSADRRSSRLILGSVFIVYDLNREGLLVNSFHKVNVEVAKTAIGVRFLDLFTNYLATCDDDLVAACYPKDRLCDTLNKSEVLLVLADSVAIDSCLVGVGVTLVTLNCDDDVLTVILGCLAHISADYGKRLELRVKLCINLKLHI